MLGQSLPPELDVCVCTRVCVYDQDSSCTSGRGTGWNAPSGAHGIPLSRGWGWGLMRLAWEVGCRDPQSPGVWVMGEKRERLEWAVRDLPGPLWKCGPLLGLVTHPRALPRRSELALDTGVS